MMYIFKQVRLQLLRNRYEQMDEKPSGKKRLDQKQLAELNKNLDSYKALSPEVQAQVRRRVIDQVNAQRKQFSQNLQAANANVKRLNLILGATGAGKSTLFNYLNGLPLIVKQGAGKDGVKNQTIRLDVDKSNVPPDVKIAPIGHGFISETTIPNFCKSHNSNETYVDCAGQFDNRDILQSIINSYFKYQLAQKAEQVKLTLVINYNDLGTNRGTTFKQTLKEVGNFIGLWDDFLKSQSISLVITNVDTKSIQNAKGKIISTITQIARDVTDMGLFNQILYNIAKRKAVAIFAAPSKKLLIFDKPSGQKDYKLVIPDGDPYNPDGTICSRELISQTLDKTNFMSKRERLFVHNLQYNAQIVVNAICEGIVQDIKAEVMSAIAMSSKEQNQDRYRKKMNKKKKKSLSIQQFEQQKLVLTERIESLTEVNTIQVIHSIFKVKKQLLQKYESLCQDLNEFQKISNIPNIQKKIMQVVKDITIFLREKIEMIDREALDLAGCKLQQMQQEIQEYKDKQKEKQSERAYQLALIDAQTQAKIKQHDMKMEQIKQNACNNMKLEMMKINMARKDKQLQYQRDEKKMNLQTKLEKKRLDADILNKIEETAIKKVQVQGKVKNDQKKVEQEGDPTLTVIQTLGNIFTAFVPVLGTYVEKKMQKKT